MIGTTSFDGLSNYTGAEEYFYMLKETSLFVEYSNLSSSVFLNFVDKDMPVSVRSEGRCLVWYCKKPDSIVPQYVKVKGIAWNSRILANINMFAYYVN